MKLRFIVEGNHSASYTVSKTVKDEQQAIRITISLCLMNLKAGWRKYTRPILYDDNNKIIKYLDIK